MGALRSRPPSTWLGLKIALTLILSSQAAANASKIGANLSAGFIVEGTLAGGNLADVVAHLARDEKLSPPLDGMLEMIPTVLPPSVVPAKYQSQYLSREQCKDAPILNEISMDFFSSKCF